jgi:branched-chain amino acid transport system substrate-binding protein
VSIDRWGNPVQNSYVRRVDKVGGKLQNSVIATFPAVSQFWKYDPDEYLRQPLYTRDHPPCPHC